MGKRLCEGGHVEEERVVRLAFWRGGCAIRHVGQESMNKIFAGEEYVEKDMQREKSMCGKTREGKEMKQGNDLEM